MVKQGDRVQLDGKTATVVSQWGQGKHVATRLDDDRVVLDLDRLIQEGKAQKVQAEAVARPLPRRELERMPREEDDIEE